MRNEERGLTDCRTNSTTQLGNHQHSSGNNRHVFMRHTSLRTNLERSSSKPTTKRLQDLGHDQLPITPVCTPRVDHDPYSETADAQANDEDGFVSVGPCHEPGG